MQYILYFYLNIYNCTYFKSEDGSKPMAIIPILHKDFHVTRDQKMYKIAPNKGAKSKSAVTLIPKEDFTSIKFLNDDSLLCYTSSDTKVLKVCDSPEAKGALWKIKRDEGVKGWRIKSNKSVGSIFSKTEYCLSVDQEKQVTIEVCNKESEHQRFLIVNFDDAIKDNLDDKESNAVAGKDDSSDTGGMGSQNKGGGGNFSGGASGNFSGSASGNFSGGASGSISKELGSMGAGSLSGMDSHDLMSLTNNSDCKPLIIDGQGKKLDLEKLKLMLQVNQLETKLAKSCLISNSKENKKIGGSFAIEPAEEKSKKVNLKPDEGIEEMFGVSENPNSSHFNPVKAAALKIYSGVDKYLGDKFGHETNIVPKDSVNRASLKTSSKKGKKASKK